MSTPDTAQAEARILWVDDEIGHLKPHLMFLEQKGMAVETATNGEDALETVQEQAFDIVFLDENMPGMGGLEVLAEIKKMRPHTPVVMITKNEAEDVMEQAIGSKIADYLIKPVNPNQILLAIKKLLKGKELVGEHANRGYQQSFTQISMAFFEDMDADAWKDIYRKLVYWDIELEQAQDQGMREVLNSQMVEANVNFGKFITREYADWTQADADDRPTLSPDLLSKYVFPHLRSQKEDNYDSVFFLLVDCLRYDQWKVFEAVLADYYTIDEDDLYFSILPTATQYARNSIFAGLFPLEIQQQHPDLWVFDEEDRGKNLHEGELLGHNLKRHGLDVKWSYKKIISNEDAKGLDQNVNNFMQNDLNVVVVNFIDMLAHARADMNVIRELSPDEPALRSISRSWLEHSALFSLLKELREKRVKIVLSTDHGVIRVKRPLKIVGDRDTSTNLRYKHGRNLNYDEKDRLIYGERKPEDIQLPSSNVSGSFAFVLEDGYFVYPNNYNKFANKYNDTLQHGGVSLEEMLVPVVSLKPKR